MKDTKYVVFFYCIFSISCCLKYGEIYNMHVNQWKVSLVNYTIQNKTAFRIKNLCNVLLYYFLIFNKFQTSFLMSFFILSSLFSLDTFFEA